MNFINAAASSADEVELLAREAHHMTMRATAPAQVEHTVRRASSQRHPPGHAAASVQ